jgi:glycosyltransferase involved in cell wall biosynthesis
MTTNSERRYRVLSVGTHPVQYASPVYREMARHPQIDLQVAYCSLQGAEAAVDPEFGIEVKWDVPLLDGYEWVRVANRSLRPGLGRFFGLFNPGLWKLIRNGNYDAVQILTGYVYASFWIALAAAKLSGTPVIFGTDATTLRPMAGGAWKRHVKRVLWPLLFRLADQVIVPSSGARDLLRSLGIAADRVTLTPYVVDNDWWLAASARVDRAAVRSSWGSGSEDSVVLFCAKLQPWKRPLDVLRAFAEASIPNARLVFAGEGPLRAEVEAEAAALGVSERVRLLGFVNQSQLPAVYTAADLLVLPSQYEAFGVVVNEAMLCGCAVAVSTHVGAARDLILPGKTGYIFSCGNVDALAGVLREALAHRKDLAEISHAARERMTTWSIHENVQGLKDAVECALARKRLRRSRGGEALRER